MKVTIIKEESGKFTAVVERQNRSNPYTSFIQTDTLSQVKSAIRQEIALLAPEQPAPPAASILAAHTSGH